MYIINCNTSWSLGSVDSNVAFQIVGAHPVEVARSSNVDIVSGFIYSPLSGDRGAIADLFPGSEGSNLYVRSSAESAVLFG